jgi:hypothetical protein
MARGAQSEGERGSVCEDEEDFGLPERLDFGESGTAEEEWRRTRVASNVLEDV